MCIDWNRGAFLRSKLIEGSLNDECNVEETILKNRGIKNINKSSRVELLNAQARLILNLFSLSKLFIKPEI